MMQWVERLCRLIDGLIGVALALMVVLVFANVVLRYAFNSGIAISEELSRWLFIWITFMGAAVAVQQRAHMGTDLFVRCLPLAARRVCLGLGQILMMAVCVLLFQGAWQQMEINMATRSAAMEVSMAWFYGAGALFALLAGLMLLLQFMRLCTGRATQAELGFAAAQAQDAEKVTS